MPQEYSIESIVPSSFPPLSTTELGRTLLSLFEERNGVNLYIARQTVDSPNAHYLLVHSTKHKQKIVGAAVLQYAHVEHPTILVPSVAVAKITGNKRGSITRTIIEALCEHAETLHAARIIVLNPGQKVTKILESHGFVPEQDPFDQNQTNMAFPPQN